MNKTKHTPGPWFVDSNHEDACFVGQDDGCAVASMVCGDGQDMRANAQLIAAAPEMLEALELANLYILSISNHPDIHNATALHLKLQDLIAKAKGETK